MKPKSEFLSLLCNLYIIVLLAALPLYLGEGYWQLGENKYLLFRNVSLLCLALWLAAGMPERLRQLGIWLKALPGRNKLLRRGTSVKRISKSAAELHSAWDADKEILKLHTERTQNQRSSLIVCAGCAGMTGSV